MKSLSFLAIVLLLCGCGKVNVDQEYCAIQESVFKRTGYPLCWERSSCDRQAIQANVEEQLADELSIEAAVTIALSNNPELQADLERLGMAKADLVQAGLLTNPYLNLDIRLPAGGPSIEGSLLTWVNDLWQLPIRRNIAKRQLQIEFFGLIDRALDTVASTKHAYQHRKISRARFELGREIVGDTEALQERIDYRAGFGFSSDLDLALAATNVAEQKIALVTLERQEKQSAIELRQVLGLNACDRPVRVSPNVTVPFEPLPDVDELLQRALSCRPDIQALRVELEQANCKIQLEKSRILRELGLGLAYETEPDAGSGIGPAIALPIPIFDQNRAQIAKAHYHRRRVAKLLRARKIAVEADLRKALERYRTAEKQIAFYAEEVMPPLDKALAYTKRYGKTMQLTLLLMLETQRTQARAASMWLESIDDAWRALIDIERIVGCSL